jgi:hypothetical protein
MILLLKRHAAEKIQRMSPVPLENGLKCPMSLYAVRELSRHIRYISFNVGA